ncbi:glycine cleavage system protein GcvH [Paenibacillus sp. 481]|uniref:glycine cleavage system protein GcvH n=1 Tax=Paenibacillus sp. 481 TaxID=2835869 RepID=UPI001E3939F0|nr:glycine cleavage system protein GcvH [Paenibacillus sp. 481]UHA76299.1 glycine cleavage system protein GcvH [Paenibacillus sp. 481]
MSEIRDNFVYSEEHEWAIVVQDRTIRVGISDHAQTLLGDIVFVEFPNVGATVSANDSIGSIESVKTVSELYCPVSGTITSINESLVNEPEKLNSDPYGDGWIFEIEVAGSVEEALKSLLTPAQYQSHIS